MSRYKEIRGSTKTLQTIPNGSETMSCTLHSESNVENSYLIPPWRSQFWSVKGIGPYVAGITTDWSPGDAVKLLRPPGRPEWAIDAPGHCQSTQYPFPMDSAWYYGANMTKTANLWFVTFLFPFLENPLCTGIRKPDFESTELLYKCLSQSNCAKRGNPKSGWI